MDDKIEMRGRWRVRVIDKARRRGAGELLGGQSVGGCQAFSHRGVTVRWLQ